MVFDSRRQPYTVVGIRRGLVAQHQHDLLAHVNRQTSEHRIGTRLELGQSVEHEPMWDGFSRLDKGNRVFQTAAWLVGPTRYHGPIVGCRIPPRRQSGLRLLPPAVAALPANMT